VRLVHFFKNPKEKKICKKQNIQNERMNFAIFSYKKAMQTLLQITNCSKYAALSLSIKNLKTIESTT